MAIHTHNITLVFYIPHAVCKIRVSNHIYRVHQFFKVSTGAV